MDEALIPHLENVPEISGSRIDKLLASIQSGEGFPSEKALQGLTPDRLSEFRKATEEAKYNLAMSLMALKGTSLDATQQG